MIKYFYHSYLFRDTHKFKISENSRLLLSGKCFMECHFDFSYMKIHYPSYDFTKLPINQLKLMIKYWLFRVKWKYTYIIGYNFLNFFIHIGIIALLMRSIKKFNIVLYIQNLKNFDIIYTYFMNDFFSKTNFLFQKYPFSCFY